MFLDSELNESKIELTAIIVFLMTLTMVYNKDDKIKTIGKGILTGLIISAVILSLYLIFTLMYTFRNSD